MEKRLSRVRSTSSATAVAIRGRRQVGKSRLVRPFDEHDLRALRRDAPQVPGFDPATTGLVVASLSGTTFGSRTVAVDPVWDPDDVTGAWRTG